MNVVKMSDEGEKMCGEQYRGYTCTRAKWHRGDHVAHAGSGYVVETWRRKRGVAEGVGGRPGGQGRGQGARAAQ